ncbi:carboxymuconolactone decarboxylase family protein [Chloroflexota bacterium]
MPEHPLKTMEDLDPKLFKLVQETRELALSDGALPRKFKFLIALALDATHGATDGVRSLAQAAINAGATKEEIAETLRITQYIGGIGSIYTASRALKDIV